MTFFPAIPVPETQVGIAVETVRGTPVAPAFWLPVMGVKYKPTRQYLPDEGLRGSMVTIYDEIAGLRFDEYGYDTYPYMDSFPVLLRALLGSKDKLTLPTPLTTLVKEAKAADKKVFVEEEVKEGATVVLDEGGVLTPLTTLVKKAEVGDKKVFSVAEVKAGTLIVLDHGTASEETRLVEKTVEIKAGEWELEVLALTYKHEIGATVTGLEPEETRVVGKVKEVKAKEWELEVEALAYKHEIGATVTGPTELVAEAKAGATTIVTVNNIAAGSYAVVGTGAGKSETVLVTKAVEEAPEEWILTIAFPLVYTYAAKATVLGLVKHQFSLLNNEPKEGQQPPSCTLTDFAGEEDWRQIVAAQLDSINLSGAADALPKAAVLWMGNVATTPSPPSASYSSAAPPPGWTVKFSINGVQVTYLVTWEFDLKRNVKNIPAITGTQNYYQHFAGPLEITSKIVVLEDPKATWLDAYENGETIELDMTLSDVQNGWTLNLHSTKGKFITGDLDRSKEWVEVPLETQLIPSAADALAGGVSPILATVGNAHPKAY